MTSIDMDSIRSLGLNSASCTHKMNQLKLRISCEMLHDVVTVEINVEISCHMLHVWLLYIVVYVKIVLNNVYT